MTLTPTYTDMLITHTESAKLSAKIKAQTDLLDAKLRLDSARDAYHKLLASMMFTRSEFRDATSRYAAARVQYNKALDAYTRLIS